MSQITRTESIKLFLQHEAPDDFASAYHKGMECQVNVAQDGGDRIEGEYRGSKWHGWSDSVQTWKPFRIPYSAKNNPHYDDPIMKFDLAQHVEGIGLTGWNWEERKSYWFGYDFDSIIGHSEAHHAKLTDEELEEVKARAMEVPWITVRTSTGGLGIHLYVYVDGVPTENHTEHAALARSILGKLSMEVNYNFASKIDVCGGNMWVWHRKLRSSGKGLQMIRKGEILDDIPPNWRDHLDVIKGANKRVIPQRIKETNMDDPFEKLVSSRTNTDLDEGHMKVIDYLKESSAYWYWEDGSHSLVTHTQHLVDAHEALGLKGIFKSVTKHSSQVNCFMFPLRDGVWVVRRFSPGVAEAESWEQDQHGWTKCFLNKSPDLKTSARASGGAENKKGQFVFQEAEMMAKSAAGLGIHLDLPSRLLSRPATMERHKDGRLLVEIEYKDGEQGDDMQGWIVDKKKWVRIYNADTDATIEAEINNYDDTMRHLVNASHEDCGWVVQSYGTWVSEPAAHVKLALKSFGIGVKDIDVMMGASVLKPWRLVTRPFEPEYLGDRLWNRKSAKLRYTPSDKEADLVHPTWNMILEHCGSGLDSAVADNPWARVNGLRNGADYLRCWIASMFQKPNAPLPYLAFWGDQNSGKSIFHEALSLLFDQGYMKSDAALTSQQGFNGELEGTVLCVVEETDLKSNKVAYNRIKEWVTARQLMIHRKGKTPYHVNNTTHWVQCSNDHSSCPIFPGDTRITMCFVKPIEEEIPKETLERMLKDEAQDFLAGILSLEIPKADGRLNVPIIITEDKLRVESQNQSALTAFIKESCDPLKGGMIPFSEFYDRFLEWIDPNEINNWSKIKMSKELPPNIPKGRSTAHGSNTYIGNLRWRGATDVVESKTLTMREGFLVEVG